jgi:hypothetical protein
MQPNALLIRQKFYCCKNRCYNGALLSTYIALRISSLRDSVEHLVCMLRTSPLRMGQAIIVSSRSASVGEAAEEVEDGWGLRVVAAKWVILSIQTKEMKVIVVHPRVE